MRGQQRKIGDLVDGVLRRWNLERRTREQRAVLLWPELVGKEIARNTQAAAVRDGVLLVSAASHAWAQTLDLMKGDILQRVRQRLGEDAVRDIHFSAGRGRPARKANRPPAKPAPAPGLSEAERAQAEQAAAEMGDPDLRDQAARAFGSLLEARRRFEQQGYRTCTVCGAVFRGKGRRCPECARRRRGLRRP